MRRSSLWWVLGLSAAASLGSILARREMPAVPSVSAENTVAFLNARWGMSLDEVTRANLAPLQPVVDKKRQFYDAQADPSRFRSFEQPQVRFLGRYATATYTFRDNRLFAYHVFVSDKDENTLDADMRRYLFRVYGDKASEQEEGSTLKLVWQSKDRMVNYWFLQDELTLIPKYTAGFGVTATES